MSKRIVGDNAEVGSADIYLKRLVLGLSMAVVALLAGIAVYSLFSQPEDPEPVAEAEIIDDDPSSPARSNPGGPLQVGDLEFPLSIGCAVDSSNDGVYLVTIHNQGQIQTDYLVSALLTSGDGSSVEALARVDALRAGEVREVVLLAEGQPQDVQTCAITAVQSDRRVLLSNG